MVEATHAALSSGEPQAIEPYGALLTAREWQAAGEQWHFHMLTPECVFAGGSDGRHRILLECPRRKALFCVTSDSRDMRLGESLARIVHPYVFEGNGSSCSAQWLTRWLDRMGQLNRQGTPWHHHMLYPECVLNSAGGGYQLVFEDPAVGAERQDFPNLPQAEFVAMEQLYWIQRA